jgi:hypothetical protein
MELTEDQTTICDRIARAGACWINTDTTISLGKAIGQLVASKLAVIAWITYTNDGMKIDEATRSVTVGKVTMTRTGVAVWWPETHGLDSHGIPTHLFYGVPGETCETCGERHPSAA